MASDRGEVLRRLDALVERQRLSGSADLDALFGLLAEGLGALPAMAVSRTDMDDVARGVAAVVGSVPPAALASAMKGAGLPVALRHWVLSLRLGEAGLGYELRGGDLVVLAEGEPVAALSEVAFHVEVTSLERSVLRLEGKTTPLGLFRGLALAFHLRAGDQAREVEQTAEYAGHVLFGHRHAEGRHLRAESAISGSGTLQMHVSATLADGTVYTSAVALTYGTYSHLTRAKYRSWRAGGSRFVARDREIAYAADSLFRSAVEEAVLWGRLLVSRRSDYRQAGLTRIAYWLTRPYFRSREIWLTHDKMYSAGDCGEYLYRHLEDNRHGFVPYYAINRDAPEVARLRAEGYRLVHPGTLRHRLVYLNAHVVFTTHANPAAYNGFSGKGNVNYRDLFRARVLCVQHGLSMQSLERIMHRTHAGIERYYCASSHEIENLSRPEYGYDPEQLVLTGIPRYDGLKSDPRRRLLVAPTWRPEYAGAASALNERRPASAEFLRTPFFSLYTRLLTDERLLRAAEERGYRVDFVLHPYLAANAQAVSAHLRERARGRSGESALNVVIVGTDAPYETILEQADLLVTDFSGIQYDFAYMDKPVVYFHPPEIPSHYGHGAMDYETMGFGEVTRSVDELVGLLGEYMRRDCVLDETYRARIASFFAYRDDHNCARILADVLGYLSRADARARS